MALMKKLTSAIVASSLVLGLVGTAGATTPDKVQAASARMLKLGLANGVTPGANPPDMALNANLTRAQLVTILVRAFGQEGNAKFLNGAASFPDAANHPWASGYIAMAKRLIAERTGGREVVGMPDGTFNPDGNVTNAEAVAFLMKFVGAPQDSTLAWPDNYIQGAANAGLITADDKAVLQAVKNEPATRGMAFYLADSTFYGYKLAEGGTTYTTFVDKVKPAITVDAVPATTLEDKVVVTGTVANDAVAVHVGTMDNAAKVVDGKFTATVDLKVGDNSILVHAVDLAGNASEQTVKVARTLGAAATVDAPAITVAAGATTDVAAVVKDAKGNAIKDAVITGESKVGTFKDGKFTAGKAAGEGSVTLKSGELTKDVKVTVTAGALAKVEGDKPAAAPGEMITLIAKDEFGNAISGATFSQTSSDAMLDGSTGKFLASKAGSYKVTAKVGDKTVDATIGVFAGFSSTSKVQISAPATIVGNGVTEVEMTAKVVDAAGNVITNFDGSLSLNYGNGALTQTAYTFKNGVATIKAKASWAATGQIVTVKGTASKGSVNVDGTASIQVVQQVATSVKVSAPAYLTVNKIDGVQNNVGAGLAVYVLDQNGEAMKTGAYAVKLSLAGPASFNNDGTANTTATVTYTPNGDTAGGHDDTGAAKNIFPLSLTSTGEITVAGEVTGLTAATAKLTAAYAQKESQVGIAKRTTGDSFVANVVTKADAVTFRAQLRDANGVPVAKQGVPVTFDLGISDFTAVKVYNVTGGARALLSANPTANTDDAGKVDLVLESESFVGDLTITAKATNLTSNSTTTKFVAGPVKQVGFARTTVKVAQGTDVVEMGAQVRDEAGNKVKKEGVKVRFTANGSDTWVSGGTQADVTTDANGVATVKVTTLGYVRPGAPYAVGIDATNSGDSGLVVYNGTNVANITIDNSAASSVSVRTGVLNGTSQFVDKFYVAQTELVKVLASVKDSKGTSLTGESVVAIFPKGTILQGGVANTTETEITMNYVPVLLSDSTTASYYVADVTFVKAPNVNFTVKDKSGVSDLTAQGTVAVKSGAAAKVKVDGASDDNKLTVTKGSISGPFTVSLVDGFGNPVFADATTGDVKVTWSYPTDLVAGNGEYFEIKSSSTGAKLDGGAAGSTLTIPVGSNSVSFYVFTNVSGKGITFNGVPTTGAALAPATKVTFTAQ